MFDGRDELNVLVLEYHDHAFYAAPFSPFTEAQFCVDGEAVGHWCNNGRVVVTRFGDGLEGHPPPHHTLVAAALALKDKIDEAVHARIAIEAFFSEFDEPAKIRLNVLELRGHEASGRGFLFRYRVSEPCDEVEQMLGDEGDPKDVFEEFLAEFDELKEAFGVALGFGGHDTRDWGYWFRVTERGLDKFIVTEED